MFSFSPREKVSRDATDEGLVSTDCGPSLSLRAFVVQKGSPDLFVLLTQNHSLPLTRPPFGGHPLPSGRWLRRGCPSKSQI